MSETITTTQQFFHSYAGDFNAIYSTRNGVLSNLVNRTFRRSMRLRYLKTLEGCQPIAGRTVLDIGYGPGHYGIALARGGARQVTGVDFASGMIEIARRHAQAARVDGCCRFLTGDFNRYTPEEPPDYVVVMGVMDYVAEPQPLIGRVVSMARRKAFFSFPVAGGVLAWQRRMRYRSRCPLYFYTRESVQALFAGIPGASARIEPIARDFFVTVTRG
jgi:2-polyprenyl-3-methyl-5-hydroxy-6-metoxy-1,4-benzoquinol methylase